MALHIKKSTGWTTVNSLYVKKSTGWTQVTKGFVKKATGWFQFWPQSGPAIDFPLTITRSAPSWPSTLTGTNYHWENADTFTFKFQSALTNSTNDSDWTDLTAYATILNPAVGLSNTKTYSVTSANFSSTIRSKWFRFVVKAVDTTNNLTKIEYSNTVNISKTDLTGTNGSAVITRQSTTSYVYNVTNNGTWSDVPVSYRYQWQQLVNSTWTDITGATLSSKDMTNFVNKQIKCLVWATDDLGAESALPISSNILTVNPAPSSITSFTVTGGVLKMIYSFEISSILNANDLVIEIKVERLIGSTWTQTDIFYSNTKSASNVIYNLSASGTYRATLRVADTINPDLTSTTPNFTVSTLFYSNLGMEITSTGFTAPTNINFSNLWVSGQSIQTGAIGWTNGANMNSSYIQWTGNYSGNVPSLAVSGQGQYVTFDLSTSTGDANISTTVTQTGNGQVTVTWNQTNAQSYKILYRKTNTLAPGGFVDDQVTGNNSASSVSVILNASYATITIQELYIYELTNQGGRQVGSTVSIPTKTLGAGTQLSASASGIIALYKVPSAPTSLTKSAESNGTMTFSWAAPLLNGGTPVTGYEVLVVSAGASFSTPVGNTFSYTPTFLAGSTGSFSVRAVNGIGSGPYIGSGLMYIPSINGAVVATAVTDTSVSISWDSTYQHAYSINIPGAPSTPYSETTSTVKTRSITGLSPGTTYTAQVVITSSTGNTASKSVTFTTLPAQPTITITGITANGFTASWSAAGASTYFVAIYRSSSGLDVSGYPKTNTSLTTSGAITGLVSGVNYTVQVYGKNSQGVAGTQSIVGVVTTSTPTGTLSVSNIGTTTAQLNFTVSNASTWNVRVSYIGGAIWLSGNNPASPQSATGLPAGTNGLSAILNMYDANNTLYQVSTTFDTAASIPPPTFNVPPPTFNIPPPTFAIAPPPTFNTPPPSFAPPPSFGPDAPTFAV